MGIRKYLDDYSKEYIIKPDGKPGLTAVYRGKYFRFVADTGALNRAKLLFGVLSLLALTCTLIPLFLESEGSHTLYVALLHVASLFPLAHLLLGVFGFIYYKTPLIREFRDKTEGRICSSSIATLIMLGATLLAETVNCTLMGYPALDLLYVVLLVLALTATATIFLFRGVLKTEQCNKNGDSL